MIDASERPAHWTRGVRALWTRLAATASGTSFRPSRTDPRQARGSKLAIDRQQRGRAGEQLARSYVKRQGYEIEATNVRYPIGELDLIARDAGTLCIIEVRSKASARFGSALESVTFRKQQHLLKAARWYLHRRRPRWNGPVRFDVVTVEWDTGRQPTVTLLRGACIPTLTAGC